MNKQQKKRIFIIGSYAPMYFIDAVVVPDFKSIDSKGNLFYVQSAEQFAMVLVDEILIGNITKDETSMKTQPCKWFPNCKKGASCKWYHDPKLGPSKDVLGLKQLRFDVSLDQLIAINASPMTRKMTLLFNGALIMQLVLYRQLLKNLNIKQ